MRLLVDSYRLESQVVWAWLLLFYLGKFDYC